VKLNRAAETPRDRRLVGDDDKGEEARLLEAIQPYPHLQALFIAALETGCRIGELLTLQWRNVDLAGNEITLISTRTKTAKTRTIPMTARLKAVVEMRRTGPDGEDHGPEAFVFGNEIGEQIKSIKVEWKAVRQAAGVVNLKFHDLRREFGSRLLEAIGGNPVIVRDWLGHADLATTNRYLATTAVALRGAAKQFESARARRFAQDSHNPADQPPTADHTPRSEVSEKSVS
jgi:integrase